LCAFAAVSFYAMHLRLGMQGRFAPAQVEEKTQPVEAS
jgi:hypothetical protein